MLHAKLVLEELKACGVAYVVGLPDNASAALAALLVNDNSVRFVSVTREGEAFALASGLWIGGKNAAVVVQNTGFLESGDALRGTAQRMRIPLVCLITYRGYAKMRRQTVSAAPVFVESIISRMRMSSRSSCPRCFPERVRCLSRFASSRERKVRSPGARGNSPATSGSLSPNRPTV